MSEPQEVQITDPRIATLVRLALQCIQGVDGDAGGILREVVEMAAIELQRELAKPVDLVAE